MAKTPRKTDLIPSKPTDAAPPISPSQLLAQIENPNLPDANKVPVPIVAQLGSTGLKEYNGYIVEDFLVQLHGRKAARIYAEMEANDGIIGAMLYACGMLIRTANWRVEAPDDSDAAEQAKEFVEQCVEDMSHSWATFIEEVTSMLTFGFAPFEIVYKVRGGPDEQDATRRSEFTDGRIGWRKIAPRSQDSIERWLFAPDGSIQGVVQITEAGKYAVIPGDRIINFRTVSRKNNPEGRSILRNSYVSYIRKKAIEDAEGRAALRAAGLVVMRIPGVLMSSEADAEQQAAYANYKTLVTNIAKDRQGGIILPSDKGPTGEEAYDLQFVVADGRRATDFSQIIERHNKAMGTSILADFLFLGQAGRGSFALSSDKTDMFETALTAYLRGIEEVLNRHLLPRLWDLNNFDPKLMPNFKASPVTRPELQQLGAYIQALAAAGAPLFPDEQLEDYLREVANLPETSDDAREAASEQQAPPNPQPTPTPGAAAAGAKTEGKIGSGGSSSGGSPGGSTSK